MTALEIGSVVAIYAAVAGYRKYHLCLTLAVEGGAAAKFLFINSDSRFEDTYPVPNDRVDCIPPNDTGESCFSFSMVPRYNADQLVNFNAKVIGEISLELAQELRDFANGVRSLARADLEAVKLALDAIIARLSE